MYVRHRTLPAVGRETDWREWDPATHKTRRIEDPHASPIIIFGMGLLTLIDGARWGDFYFILGV